MCLFHPNPDKTLYVITSLFNPRRYESRYRLYRQFEDYMLSNPNVVLVTVECAFGNRDFVVKSKGRRHKVIRRRTNDELWSKENLLNIGIESLHHVKYYAIIDADIKFTREDWVQETIHQLQHHRAIQMFSNIVYLGPCHQYLRTEVGVVEGWNRGYNFKVYGNNVCNPNPLLKPNTGVPTYGYGWNAVPGGAWAFNRKETPGFHLPDFAILGGGDSYMSFAFLGVIESVLPVTQFEFDPEFLKAIREYADFAYYKMYKSVGNMNGTILHMWHGPTKSRNYWNRNHILANNKYDPNSDIIRKRSGIIELTGNKPQLREDLKNYFSARNEDSIDLD